MKQILSAKGFEVEKYISPEEELKGLSQEEKIKNIAGIYAAKRPIKNLTKKYDLIINIANVNPGTVQRIVWPASKRNSDIPFTFMKFQQFLYLYSVRFIWLMYLK